MATFLAFTHRTKFPCPEPADTRAALLFYKHLGLYCGAHLTEDVQQMCRTCVSETQLVSHLKSPKHSF